MPRIHMTHAIVGADVSGIRALCNGCDPVRPCDEHAERARLWLLTAGAFELRDAAGRHVIDPTQGIVMPRGHGFQIRHRAGPDVCLAFGGPVVDALAAEGARRIAISPGQIARITTALTERDELGVAEVIAELGASAADPAPDRDLSAAIADALRTRYAEPTSLGELAEVTGYSMFHACRVFRATTGTTIHGFRRELRLRHALARILDGDESLSAIALATGFASQSHLTNRFRARFGLTPARARSDAGRRALAAS